MQATKQMPGRLKLVTRENARAAMKNPVILFIIIALFFGGIFVVKTPPLWGGDETTHFARAYQITQGHLVAERLSYPFGDKSYGGQLPKSVYDLIWHVNADIITDNNATSYGVKRIDNIDSYKPFTDQKINSKVTKTYFFPNTAAYSPVAYIPSIIAIKLATIVNASLGHTIFLARLFGLLFYIACVGYTLYALRSLRYVWLVFAVALLPMLVFQASIICGDVIANAFAIVVVGLITKSILERRLTRTDVAVLATTAVLLPVVKPNYIFLSLLVLLIPASTLRSVKSERLAKNFKPLLIGLSFIALLVWTYFTRQVPEAIRLIGVGSRFSLIDVSKQTHFVLRHPFAFIEVVGRTLLLQDTNFFNGMFGQLSFDFVQVPAVSIVSSALAMLLAIGISEKFKDDTKRNLLAAVIVAAGVVSIFGTFYLTFSNVAEPIIEGVQGRYFLPFLLVGLTIICMITPKLRLQAAHENASRIGESIALLSVISLSFAAIKLFYVLLG